jgi:hypothetical protein
MMIPIYFGHDERTEAGSTVFLSSLMRHAERPMMLCPLTRRGVPGIPEGSNAFTLRRFLVPYSQGYQGWAVFVDGSDMLCRADIGQLAELRDDRYAVQVVQHSYQTRNPRKYRGTPMESDNVDYPRKQWVSVMLLNAGHPAWRVVDPEFVATSKAIDLLQLRFLPDEAIGHLPYVWNWLADEMGENPDAKVVHFTAGIPAFLAHADAPMADEWRAELELAGRASG